MLKPLMFQFHKGAIKSTGDFSLGSTNLGSFNSIKVRLKVLSLANSDDYFF